jgi:hypothetical protein
MYRKVAAKTSTSAAPSAANHFVNALTKSGFAVHDAAVLSKAAKALGIETSTAINEVFVKTKGIDVSPKAEAIALPLASIGFDGRPLAADAFPRRFYLQSHVSAVAPESLATVDAPQGAPRCGLTGKFFAKEEVVDNLMMAALELKFSSPFWIRDTHPELGKFLELRAQSSAIELPVTTCVVPLDSINPIPASLLHPSVRSRSAPRGANAMTGLVPLNPWFAAEGPPVWLSLDQIAQHGMSFKTEVLKATTTLVHVEQWVMFNAEQLTMPGRLSLNRAKGFVQKDDITKIFT